MPLSYPGKANGLVHTNMDLAVSITAESNAFAVATTANWLSMSSWRALERRVDMRPLATSRASYGAIEALDLGIWCDAATTLTSALLYGVRQCPQVLADDDVDAVDTTDNELDITGHAYLTGDGPVTIATAGTLPGGLTAGVSYWIRVIDSDSIKFYLTLADAVANTSAVDLTSAGTGTFTISDVQSSANADNDTQRLHFFLYGSLNGGDTITLAAQTAYIERIEHSPLTLYYAINCSTSATETVTVRAVPVQRVEY